jgi:hypothetical protein
MKSNIQTRILFSHWLDKSGRFAPTIDHTPTNTACTLLPFMKTIKIALLGTQHDYKDGIVPRIIAQLGYQIRWVQVHECDLLIYGAFYSARKAHAWLPKPLRALAGNLEQKLKDSLNTRSHAPVSVFHTCENKRPDMVATDFAITFDLGPAKPNQLRLPYWMELVDWSHEGIVGNTNPRYGELLSLTRLGQALGDDFLKRPQVASMITSHLLEPRRTLLAATQRAIPVEGYGPYFDSSIKNHHQSYFVKKAVLQKYAFNLCPENSLYPGYYTEKIPESFQSGALPLGWTDTNVCADFNPKAFINLEPMAHLDYAPLTQILNSEPDLRQFCDQPLLLKKPSLDSTKQFIAEILRQAST